MYDFYRLVSSILHRPRMLTLHYNRSHVRVQVEQTRLELLKWTGKYWLGIRQERGIDALEVGH
jgi:hypothetical protein